MTGAAVHVGISRLILLDGCGTAIGAAAHLHAALTAPDNLLGTGTVGELQIVDSVAERGSGGLDGRGRGDASVSSGRSHSGCRGRGSFHSGNLLLKRAERHRALDHVRISLVMVVPVVVATIVIVGRGGRPNDGLTSLEH